MRVFARGDARETHHESVCGGVVRRHQLASLTVAASRIISRELGQELTMDFWNVKKSCQIASVENLSWFAEGICVYSGTSKCMSHATWRCRTLVMK